MQSINPLVQNKNNKSLILEHAKYLRIKCYDMHYPIITNEELGDSLYIRRKPLSSIL